MITRGMWSLIALGVLGTSWICPGFCVAHALDEESAEEWPLAMEMPGGGEMPDGVVSVYVIPEDDNRVLQSVVKDFLLLLLTVQVWFVGWVVKGNRRARLNAATAEREEQKGAEGEYKW